MKIVENCWSKSPKSLIPADRVKGYRNKSPRSVIVLIDLDCEQ